MGHVRGGEMSDPRGSRVEMGDRNMCGTEMRTAGRMTASAKMRSAATWMPCSPWMATTGYRFRQSRPSRRAKHNANRANVRRNFQPGNLSHKNSLVSRHA
jgi:hypothetical protein